MANIKSAGKRARQAEKSRKHNMALRSLMRTKIKFPPFKEGHRYRLLVGGAAIAVGFWAAEALVHTHVFHDGDLARPRGLRSTRRPRS